MGLRRDTVYMAKDIGVQFIGIEQIVRERQEGLDSLVPEEIPEDYSSLRSHILKAFQENREARENGGVNRLLMEALRAYNGQYDPEDEALIVAEGGSRIYMNLTSTKCRAAISWIKDLLLAGKVDAFGIEPTPVVDLPEGVAENIKELISKEFEKLMQPPTPPPIPMGAEGAPPAPPPDIAKTVRELNEYKRDLHESIMDEINKEASFEFKKLETKIKDRMKEGSWEKALSEFIDDFCIFPTAFLKGPIVTRKKRLKWDRGTPVATEDYVFHNKRVSPLDIYPAPEATSVQDGDFLEHIRLSRKELSSFMRAGEQYKYKSDAIRKVLENEEGKGSPLDTHIEDDKAREELREGTTSSNKNVYHGLHYWGSVSVKMLQEWGMEEGIEGLEEEDTVEVEAILVGSEVIKCIVNDDPLERRPYYSASFQKRPGSIWGSAPPYLMRDIQRMCNACARALANNLGLSSGPLMELVIDRLADGQDVSQLKPRDIIQTTSDPTGGSGRAVQFFTVPSVAQELLAVYAAFEIRADDVTMIPRYAYGNEKVGGAAQTASGLSMMLESANKGIKDAIRHIDEGLIIPRVQKEFYMTLLAGDFDFSGDINVLAYGSQMLTMAGAEQMRRNEFLQVTANPVDQEIMGPLARAEILRVMTKDLNLGEDLIPNRQILKDMMRKKEASQQAPPPQVQAAQIQNDTILQIAQERNALQQQDLQRKAQKDNQDAQIQAARLQQEAQAKQSDHITRLQAQQMKTASQEHQANQKIAVELQSPRE
jgi:hypothetical protein